MPGGTTVGALIALQMTPMVMTPGGGVASHRHSVADAIWTNAVAAQPAPSDKTVAIIGARVMEIRTTRWQRVTARKRVIASAIVNGSERGSFLDSDHTVYCRVCSTRVSSRWL